MSPAVLPVGMRGSFLESSLLLEEKRSDVNLAVHILNDAWKDEYDCAVVVSNDSDMTEALKLVKENIPDKNIGLIPPILGTKKERKKKTSSNLTKYADFTTYITEMELENSQFPDFVEKASISMPVKWKSVQ